MYNIVRFQAVDVHNVKQCGSTNLKLVNVNYYKNNHDHSMLKRVSLM